METDIKTLKGKLPVTDSKLGIKVTEPGAPERITALVYGAPGAGKTYFAGTFPKPIFVDMMGGLMAVRAKRVAYVQPKNYTDLLMYSIPANVEPYETVVIDTITEGCRLILESALEMTGNTMPKLPDWAMAAERLRKIVRAYLNIPKKHILFIAHEKFIKDEDSGKVTAGPLVTGQMFHDFGGLVDCMFHIRNKWNPEKKEKGRYILTEPDGMYPAKDRTGTLDKLEIPDFGVIWQKMCK